MKKFLALMIAAMMLLSMGTVAFAATDTTAQIPVTKTLYFVNQQGAQVYEPDITYTYEVTSANPNGATVTDAAGHTVTVKQGDMRGFTKAANSGTPDTTSVVSMNLVYSPNHVRVTVPSGENGVGVTKKNSFPFDAQYLKTAEGVITPGVYRYLITETTTVGTKNGVGIEEVGTPDKTLVLDVFVKADGEVAGSTIHDPGFDPDDDLNNNDPDGNNDPSDADDTNGKTTGFGDGDDPSGTDPKDTDPADDANDPTVTPDDDPNGQLTGLTTTSSAISNADKYETYNLGVTKTTSGDMADGSHKFPFSIALANSITSAPYSYFDTTRSATLDYGSDSATYAAVKKAVSAAAITDTLKNGETVLFKGVPSAVANALTAAVTETNDTADTYTTTLKIDNTDAAFDDASTATLDSTKKTATVANTKTAATGAVSVKNGNENLFAFNNALDSVSPTGVVLRFAPYIAMLVAGAALFIILAAKRRKNDEEE